MPVEDDTPGCGAMLVKFPGLEDIPLPLKHTDVQADVVGYIATVEITQQFHNPYHTKIEAVYVFPLPQNAAVNDFLMTIGDRTIRGIIREREEAERIKVAAKAELDQEVNRAKEALRGQVVEIATAGAGRILKRELDKTANDELIKDLVAQI